MSENSLYTLITYAITALVTVLLAAITAWKTAKLGAHAGAVEAIEPVEKQLKTNANTMESMHGSVATLKREMDGRLTEYRNMLEEQAKMVQEKAVVDVAAALIRGRAEGIKIAEAATGKTAEAILAEARDKAEKILQTARVEAEKLKEGK